MRKFRTIRRQLEAARWKREDVDKLVGDLSNPKPQRTIAADGAEPPLDLQDGHATSIDQENNPAGCLRGKAQDVAAQKRCYVTGKHGRTMGCPRCESGLRKHDTECQRRIEGILMQQSRVQPKDDAQPQTAATTAKSVPMEQENPTTTATQHGGSSGVRRSGRCKFELHNDASRCQTGARHERRRYGPLRTCTTPSKWAKTNHGTGDLRAGAHG